MSLDQNEINALALVTINQQIKEAEAEVTRLKAIRSQLKGEAPKKAAAAKGSAKKKGTRPRVADRTADAIEFLESNKGKKFAKKAIMDGAKIAANEWLKVSKGLDASKKIKSEGERRNKVYSA